MLMKALPGNVVGEYPVHLHRPPEHVSAPAEICAPALQYIASWMASSMVLPCSHIYLCRKLKHATWATGKAVVEAPTAADTLITVEDVSKSHDGMRYLFEDLNFSLSRGQRMAIIGANGSGITTPPSPSNL